MEAEYTRFRLAHDTAIYLAYGTDITAAMCDTVPLFFIAEGKETLTLKRYLGLEHNFFGVHDGAPDYDDEHWPEVMAEFVEWLPHPIPPDVTLRLCFTMT